MGDESEWTKLPTEEKCQHKAWKARVTGYEELIKTFQKITDEKSPEFGKYLGHVKKFVVDSNVVAQEKGLEVTLIFTENYFHAGKAAGEVCCGIVTKCLNQKPKIRDLGVAIMMAFIEAEKQEIVQEELLKGLSNKQPKVVAACVVALREALRDFGTKIILIKPILKQLQTLLEDRDKSVRDEAKLLAIEIHRWIGPALKPQLANLKSVQMAELEAEFDKLPPTKPQQTRFLRSQEDLKAKMMERAAAGDDVADSNAVEAPAPAEEVDGYEYLPAVDVLSKLPADFYDKVEEKKWQERKMALEAVQKLVETPKLQQGDYNDLIRALKKVVSKDTNVMLVTIAAKCITLIAVGLRKKFNPHAVGCIECILEKFKEKKPAVVQTLKEAVDACSPSTNLEAISETCIAALDHKTPSVKAETASFLARCFSKCTPATLPKKILKPFIAALLKTANDTSPEVREASFEALGTAMKVITEKAIMPFLADVDNLKMAKIKECCEKAATGSGGLSNNQPGESAKSTVSSKPAAAAAAKPGTAAAKGPPKKQSDLASASASSSSTSVSGAKKKAGPGKGKKEVKEEVVERELSDEAVEEKMASLFPGDVLPGLASANWKDRLGSLERMAATLKTLAKDDIPVQAFIRTLIKKPGLKDNHFQVLKLKLEVVSTLAQRGNFSKRSADCCLNEVVDKIGDVKNGSAVQECLSNIAEATSLDFVAPQVLSFAFEQKNPKNQSEALNWLSAALKQFGLKLNVKGLIETINSALASANPTVRTSGISLLGVLYIYMGPPLRVFFEKEKPTLLQQIDAEFEKVKDEKPTAPTRGLKAAVGDGGAQGDDDEGGDASNDEGSGTVNPADLFPRVDISDKMTDALLTELGDKNWKVRKEALEKLQVIVSDAKFITPNIGALPDVLKHRLVDSNKILCGMAIALCQQLATSMGSPIRQHVRSFLPGIFSNLGDSKPHVRQAATTALNTILEQMGPTGMAATLEGDMLLDAFKHENPTLRAELFGWLTEKLPSSKKLPLEFLECVPILFACLEDRNADVRKKANEAVLPFMMHCGFDPMLQKVSVIKPASKDVVMKALEAARPNLPAKPGKSASATHAVSTTQPPPAKAAAKATSAPKLVEDDDAGSNEGIAVNSNVASKPKSGKAGGAAATAQKKSSTTSVTAVKKKQQVEEEDTGPPMKVSNAKERRIKDEKSLKVLKWNFDSPRKEFVEQLKSQMETHFSKTLLDQLFHADFKNHIKAMDTLIRVCDSGIESTVSNLDLILKWMTLRFFDTNTTVLLKCLEYLLVAFDRLVGSNYHMTEAEANSFVPYLINKVGDPKDNIRRDIRNIIQLIVQIYPSSLVAQFLMEGLKSKNAKQRTECLEELTRLLQVYGMTVCHPNPATSLKLIAQQIGDRDNGVRSAALNTIVAAYEILGESIFKYIGNLNDKDMTMLEERLKRSARLKPSEAVQPINPPPPQKHGALEEKPRNARASSALSGNIRPDANQVAKGPFQLELSDALDYEPYIMPKLIEPDLDDIFGDPIKYPVIRNRVAPPTRLSTDLIVNQVLSLDPSKCILAIQQIDAMLNEGKKSSSQTDDGISAPDRSIALRGHVDQLLTGCTLQLKNSQGKHAINTTVQAETIKLYKSVLGVILALCRCKHLAMEASSNVIKDLIQILVATLVDSKLDKTDGGAEVNHAVNITVVKILENMNPDIVMRALIELLQETVGSEDCSPQFQELIMKCLWKVTRMIPNNINQLDLSKVIKAIDSFLAEYPAHTWNKGSDMPLRTLKTILHTLIKLKGNKILNHLPPPVRVGASSEVEQYIRRVLKSMSSSADANESMLTDSVNSNASLGGKSDQDPGHKSHRISKAIQDSLADIFKKIGCKETTSEGLDDLYDFKIKHPDADLEPFLKKSSVFFQDYINKGLKFIDVKRQENGTTIRSQSQSTGQSQQVSNASSADAWLPPAAHDLTPRGYLERLKFLRAKCGLDNSEFFVNLAKNYDATPNSNLDAESFLGVNLGKTNQSVPDDVVQAQGDSLAIDAHVDQQMPERTVSNLDELKKRLERIKKSGRD